eukprot:SAG31_NODE_1527_length_8004_cov_2.107147_2_plen_573_part_00
MKSYQEQATASGMGRNWTAKPGATTNVDTFASLGTAAAVRIPVAVVQETERLKLMKGGSITLNYSIEAQTGNVGALQTSMCGTRVLIGDDKGGSMTLFEIQKEGARQSQFFGGSFTVSDQDEQSKVQIPYEQSKEYGAQVFDHEDRLNLHYLPVATRNASPGTTSDVMPYKKGTTEEHAVIFGPDLPHTFTLNPMTLSKPIADVGMKRHYCHELYMENRPCTWLAKEMCTGNDYLCGECDGELEEVCWGCQDCKYGFCRSCGAMPASLDSIQMHECGIGTTVQLLPDRSAAEMIANMDHMPYGAWQSLGLQVRWENRVDAKIQKRLITGPPIVAHHNSSIYVTAGEQLSSLAVKRPVAKETAKNDDRQEPVFYFEVEVLDDIERGSEVAVGIVTDTFEPSEQGLQSLEPSDTNVWCYSFSKVFNTNPYGPQTSMFKEPGIYINGEKHTPPSKQAEKKQDDKQSRENKGSKIDELQSNDRIGCFLNLKTETVTFEFYRAKDKKHVQLQTVPLDLDKKHKNSSFMPALSLRNARVCCSLNMEVTCPAPVCEECAQGDSVDTQCVFKDSCLCSMI